MAARHPDAQLSYTHAGLAIAHHIAQARSQAAYWRLNGIASAVLCASLAALVAFSARSAAVVHVVETTSSATAHDDRGSQGAKLLVVFVTNATGRITP